MNASELEKRLTKHNEVLGAMAEECARLRAALIHVSELSTEEPVITYAREAAK